MLFPRNSSSSDDGGGQNAAATSIEGEVRDARGEKEGEEEELADQAAGSSKFDRRLTVSHSYLGNVYQGEILTEALFVEPGNSITIPGRFQIAN